MSIVKLDNLYVKCLGQSQFGFHSFDNATSRDHGSRLVDHVAINLVSALKKAFPKSVVVIEHV